MEIKWEEFILKADNAKELHVDNFASETEFALVFDKMARKLNHRTTMILYKFIGKHHIKIPKQSRKKWRR